MSVDRAANAFADAILDARARRATKQWATVSSVSPLLVRFGGSGIDVGPLPYVRGKPGLGEQVLVLTDRDGSQVVVGRSSAAGNVLAAYQHRVSPGPYQVYVAEVADDDSIVSRDALVSANFNNSFIEAKNESPHLFKMSDKATVLLYDNQRSAFGSIGYYYAIKPDGGSWSALTFFAADPSFSFNEADVQMASIGDNIYVYAHGYQPTTSALYRLAYSAGAITVTSVPVGGSVAQPIGFGIYCDATNNLVHLWWGDNGTVSIHNSPDNFCPSTYLSAFDAVTLALVYESAGPGVRPFDFAADGSDMDGDGTSTFFCTSVTTFWNTFDWGATQNTAWVDRIVAGPASYSITHETGLPAVPWSGTGENYACCVWDGEKLNIVASVMRTGLFVLARLAANSYESSWTVVTDPPSPFRMLESSRFGVAAPDSGDLAVVYDVYNPTSFLQEIRMLRRRSGTWQPSVTIDLGDADFPSSNRHV